MEHLYLIITASFALAMIVTAFLFLRRNFEQRRMLYVLSILLFVTLIIVTLLDLFYRLFAGDHISVDHSLIVLTGALLYILLPTVMGFWFLYAAGYFFPGKIPRAIFIGTFSLLGINVVLTLISFIPGTNLIFVLNDTSFERGQVFWLNVLVYAFFYIAFLVLYVIFYNKQRGVIRALLYVIFTLPIFGVSGQIINKGLPLIILSYAFTFMLNTLTVQYIHATTDFLTGLANRLRLSTFLNKKMSRLSADSSFSILIIDIDNFKDINDTLGHTVGDNALYQTGTFLKSFLNDDDFAARLGGDEFVYVTNTRTHAELLEFLEKMRKELAEYTKTQDLPYELTFSGGIFTYHKRDKLTITELLSIIDLRMFKDKKLRKAGEL